MAQGYYHSSPDATITTFYPFSHFGDRETALVRARATAARFLYTVELDVAAPLRMADLVDKVRGSMHSTIRLTDVLFYDMALLSSAERDSVMSLSHEAARARAELAHILRAHGYDSIVYSNDIEGAGRDSWIILEAAQATILSVETIFNDGN